MSSTHFSGKPTYRELGRIPLRKSFPNQSTATLPGLILGELRRWTRKGFLNPPGQFHSSSCLILLSSTLKYPLAPSSNTGAFWTPRSSFDVLRHGSPFMSFCASELENRALIYIFARQTHSAFIYRKSLEKCQTKPLITGACRAPSPLDDVAWSRFPAVPELTSPC